MLAAAMLAGASSKSPGRKIKVAATYKRWPIDVTPNSVSGGNYTADLYVFALGCCVVIDCAHKREVPSVCCDSPPARVLACHCPSPSRLVSSPCYSGSLAPRHNLTH